jgi:hypothetical protein
MWWSNEWLEQPGNDWCGWDGLKTSFSQKWEPRSPDSGKNYHHKLSNEFTHSPAPIIHNQAINAQGRQLCWHLNMKGWTTKEPSGIGGKEPGPCAGQAGCMKCEHAHTGTCIHSYESIQIQSKHAACMRVHAYTHNLCTYIHMRTVSFCFILVKQQP